MSLRKEPTKREQVIEIVDRNIKQGNMGFDRLYKLMKSETGYQFFRKNGCTDDLLETYVKGLGLTFEMSFRGLDDWRQMVVDDNHNEPIKDIPVWEKIVKTEIGRL